MSFTEWSNNKHKKKRKEQTFTEWSNNKHKNNDIAPVKTTVSTPTVATKKNDDILPVKTTKKDDDKRKFFQKSEYFADGKWDKGDLTRTILGSVTDLGEKISTGAIGSGEKLLDFSMMLGNAMNEQNLNQAAQNELIFNRVTGKETKGVLENYNAFQKQAEKEATEFVAKDLYDESAIAKQIISAPVKEKTGVDSETASIFAERSDELAVATGEMVTTKLVGTILGGPMGLFATGFTSAGSEVEEALKQGATYDEAVTSGITTAAAAMGTGAIFNGVKFGGQTLTEGAVQKVASAISSKTLQTLTKWGINTVGEGVEEVLEDAMTAVGKKLTYLDEKEFNEIFNSETAWESFLGGIILGGMFEGVDVGVNKIKGTDYVTGSTKSEQNTLNKLVEERVTEATRQNAIEKAVNKAITERETEQGGKLSDENKKAVRETIMAQIESGELELSSEALSKEDVSKIKKEVKDSLKNGNIDLSKLEEILTPDEINQINELKESLNNTKDEQVKAEIQGKINQLELSRLENLKNQARDNKYLRTAIDERIASEQRYQDDSEITDEYEKAVVESAKKYANNTKVSRKFVDIVRKLAKDRKTRYVFTNNQALLEQGDLKVRTEISSEDQAKIKSLEKQLSEATTKEAKASIQAQIIALKYNDTGGLVRVNENGVETVLINVDSIQSKYSVLGHETKHTLEKYELNETFNKILFDYAESKGELKAVRERIENVYKDIENVDIDGEIASELTGKYLFEDEKFLDTLLKNKSDSKVQQAIEKIKELIDDLVIRFKGTEQEKQFREIQKKFTELYNSTDADIVGETTEGTQYALNKNGKSIAKKGKSTYNEVNTIVMQWANNPGTQQGDTKSIFDGKGNTWAIAIADENAVGGYRIKYSGANNEVADYERIYRKENDSFDRYDETYQSNEGRYTDSLWEPQIREGGRRNSEFAEGEQGEIERDSGTTNDEYVRSNTNEASRLNETKAGSNESASFIGKKQYSLSDNHKQKQLDVINKYHPKADWDNQTWITSVDDIKTYAETVEDESNYATTPDFTDDDVANALKTGKVKVYSSHDIRKGTFVTPSYMEAKNYAGQGKVNSMVVNLEDVAWIDSLQGQYAPVENDTKNSLSEQGENTDYSKSLQAIRYKGGIIPFKEDIEKKPTRDFSDVVVPLREEEANAMLQEQNSVNTFSDEDVPPDVDTPIYDMGDTTRIDDTTLKGIAQNLSDTLSLTAKEAKAIQEVVQKYSTTEFPNRENLFKEIKEKFGEKSWSERNEEVAEVKQILKGYRIKVSDTIKGDIADYGEWQRKQWGKLVFSKDGLSVDDIYEGLSIGYPHFFPDDVVNPTDQLLLMSEVANMDTETIETFDLDDDTIQQATDIVISEVNKYKEAELSKLMQEEQSHFYKEVIANDDLVGKREQLNEWYENRKAELHEELDDKNAFVSKKAMAFYNELNNLKKGVRASEELGYFLDFGFKWNELKSTLLQVSKWPDEVIRPGSNVESIVREAIGREYEDRLYDFMDLDMEYKEKLKALENPVKSPIQTVKERVSAKLESTRKELLMNQQLRDDSIADFEQEISRLQAEYNAKDNKNTKVANNLLRRIERLQRMKNDVAADYSKRISDLEAKRDKLSEEMRTGESPSEQGAMRKELHQSKIDNIKNQFAKKGFDFDKVLSNAKNLSTPATVDNTPQRVMEKALGYKEGQALADETVNKVAQNETEGIKWLNSFTNKKNGVLVQLSEQYNIKPGSKESAAAQMYAEGFYVDKNNNIVEYGEKELKADFPNAKVRENIKGLARDPRIRQIYDETLARINESRSRNAYPEIQKLDNYFLHFRAMEDTFSRLGLPFNPNDIKAQDLPTDLNGVTANLKPGQPYFASANHRTGKRTSFDMLGGLERYLSSAKNQIYHIDDIQTLRALRNYVADTFGQAKGLENLDSLSEEEAQERIKQIYNSHLSTFAKFLNEEANVIAGKKSDIDRSLEAVLGRRVYTFMDTVNKQVGSNMVGFNISSSLTNFLPVVQTFAKTQKRDFVKAFAQTVSNKISGIYGKNDGFSENSPVVIRRKGAERFYRTPFQKVGDSGYLLMSAIDDISTELIARTKYNEFTRKGMDSQQAHFETDKWVSRLMGDRSLGQMPQVFNSKMLGLVTKFQLEVRNQLDSQFYDTVQEAKVSNEQIENALARNAKIAAKVGSTFLQLTIAQHLFGKAFESIAGYNPAFDIIDVLIKTFGFDDDEEDEDTPLDNLEQGFHALLEDLPYTSTILNGGRMPITTALPIKEFVNGEDDYGNEVSRIGTLLEAAPYLILPTGYGQIKKTAKGLNMFNKNNAVAGVTGSYTDSGNLRFPVEDTLGNRVKAGIFGQYANENARKYFDDDIAPLKEKQIQEYAEVELPIADYWKYREGLKDLETLNEKGDYIGGLDLPVSKKNILINNIADRDKPIDYTGFENYSDFEEFDFATRYPEKYKVLQEQGISVKDYKENYEDGFYKFTDDFSWAADNQGKYTLSKAVTDDVMEYKQYTTDLSNIEADKDSKGNSISGSKKAKVIKYINGLDVEYGAKCILLKSKYPKEDRYNDTIVEYLNNRYDISTEEKITILEELGATVDSKGNVDWD